MLDILECKLILYKKRSRQFTSVSQLSIRKKTLFSINDIKIIKFFFHFFHLYYFQFNRFNNIKQLVSLNDICNLWIYVYYTLNFVYDCLSLYKIRLYGSRIFKVILYYIYNNLLPGSKAYHTLNSVLVNIIVFKRILGILMLETIINGNLDRKKFTLNDTIFYVYDK